MPRSEKPASHESVHATFESKAAPELVGKRLGEALDILQKQYGTRLASLEDLKKIETDIKSDPKAHPEIERGRLNFAFAHMLAYGGFRFVPYLFLILNGDVSRSSRPIESRFSRDCRVLLKA